MRRARVYIHGAPAGILTEHEPTNACTFSYLHGYDGDPVSLSMPLRAEPWEYPGFPPFFEGLLPEGIMLEGLLRERKIDRADCFSQLICVGADLPGSVTVEEIHGNMPDNI